MSEMSKEEHRKLEESLKGPDALQKTTFQFWHWVEKNWVSFALVGLVIAVAGLGKLGYGYMLRSKEAKAQQAFYTVEAKYLKVKEDFDKSDMEAFSPKKADPKADGKPLDAKKKSGDLEKDFGSLAAEFEKIAQDHKGTSTSAQAGLYAMELYLDYKSPQRAVAVGEALRGSLASDHLLKGLVDLGLGNALAASGDCAKSVSVWQAVIDRADMKSVGSEVAMRSGLCFEKMGQEAKAIEMYRKASAGDAASGGPAVQTAKTLLRVLELKSAKAGADIAKPSSGT
jgi:tetratricopeptide (TPR) repeat protein